jgi:hypothetical protein
MLMGFSQTVKVPHRIPFPLKPTNTASSGTGSVSVDPSYQQKMNNLAQGNKPSVGSINPLGSGGFATGSPIPSGTDVQQGNYNIPGF